MKNNSGIQILKKFTFHASFFRKLLKEFPPQEMRKPRQGFPGDSLVKNPSAKAGDMGLVPGLRRSSGEGNGTPSSILAWEISWTEESGGLKSMVLEKSQTQLSYSTITTNQERGHEIRKMVLWCRRQ